MTKLFVTGFPRSYGELDLAKLFGPFGDIDVLSIARDKFTGASKGFGFVEMKTPEGAAAASAGLDGEEIKGKKLEVRLAAPPRPKPSFQRRYDKR